MKKVVLFFGLLILATITFAQAPKAFNYQAVIRDADGNLLENQAVGIKISLLQGSATGQEVYAETHATTTNQFGQLDLKIGIGTATTGQFTAIPWKSGDFYLKLAVDISGGTNFQVMGITQMLSVPYALYAEEGSGWEKNENGISFMNGNVGIGFMPQENKMLSVNGIFRNYVTEFYHSDTVYGYVGRGKTITGGWTSNNHPDVLTLTYDKIDFAIGGWAKNGSGWQGAALFINSDNGNVGIGDISPNKKLVVNGDVSLKSNTNELLVNKIRSISGPIDFFISGNAFRINSDVGDIFRVTGEGHLYTRKIIVQNSWSDFVFDDDYSLMPLHQLDKFIEENKHLPEIPSAKEVEANGISLGDMDAKLLQKIEELTLYAIEQQKMIDKLVKDNEELARKVSKIQKRK
jgi:hypothetical protein